MPTGNHLIDGLDTQTRDALHALLRPCTIAAGEVLIEPGEPVETLHFPRTAYLINRLSNARGQTLQVTFIGREGVSGLAPFLADAPCSWSVIGQGAGEAFIGSAREVRRLAEETPPLMRRLHQLSHFYQAEAHQLAIAATYDSIAGRLASWLLAAFHLSGRGEIRVTQEEIAHHLGVQRTSIVEAYHALTAAKAVRLIRGRVTLVDEAALRRLSCGAFDLVQEMGRNLGVMPEGEEAAA